MGTLLTLPQAAKKLGISMVTAYRWIAAGRLPVVRLTPRTIRVKEEALEALIETAAAPASGA